jgi:hypothetical protein
MSYYPDYVPKDADRFERMLNIFRACQTDKEFEQMRMAFILDLSYHRQDIIVAMGRVERERQSGGRFDL